jgi:hypothetical protein
MIGVGMAILPGYEFDPGSGGYYPAQTTDTSNISDAYLIIGAVVVILFLLGGKKR